MSPGEVKAAYLSVQADLANMFYAKILQYGVSRYNNDYSNQFNFWMCFSDVHRKTLRLEELTKKAIEGDAEATEKLIDDYKDIANYAIMAVQILEEYDDGV